MCSKSRMLTNDEICLKQIYLDKNYFNFRHDKLKKWRLNNDMFMQKEKWREYDTSRSQ